MLQCSVRISAHNMHLGHFHCTNTIVLFPMRAFTPTISSRSAPVGDHVYPRTRTRGHAPSHVLRVLAFSTIYTYARYAHAVNAQFDRVMRARVGMLREGLGSISGKQKSKKQKRYPTLHS